MRVNDLRRIKGYTVAGSASSLADLSAASAALVDVRSLSRFQWVRDDNG